MKAISISILAFVMMVLAALPAAAQDLFSISLDAPIDYTFDNGQLSDADPSGFKASVALPFFIGFGLEDYEVTGTLGPFPGSPFTYDVSFVDIFLNIPSPAVNFVIGGGVGKGTFDTVPASGAFSEADLTQVFVSVGIPIALVFDIHVGYHAISGGSDVLGGTPLSLDANMVTVGVNLGF